MEYRVGTVDDPSMTIQKCVSSCQQLNYVYAGLEFGSECFCSMSLPTNSSTACTNACLGDSSDVCGGKSALSVFKMPCTVGTTKCSARSGVMTCSSTGFWDADVICPIGATCQNGACVRFGTDLGCKADKVDGSNRVMEYTAIIGDASLTLEKCAVLCHNKQYAIAGAEFGGECYCSNNIATTNATNCNMTCNGNKQEFCGGRSALTTMGLLCTPGQSKCTPDGHVLQCSNGFWGTISTCPPNTVCSSGSCVDQIVVAVSKDIVVDTQANDSPTYAYIYCEGNRDSLIQVSNATVTNSTSTTLNRRESSIHSRKIVNNIVYSGLVIHGCRKEPMAQTVHLYCRHEAAGGCGLHYGNIRPHAILSLHDGCAGGYFARVASVVEVPANEHHHTPQKMVKKVVIDMEWAAFLDSKQPSKRDSTSSEVAFLIE
ncbi:hypothetical protein HDU76_002466, partial [Blyttiomyces sp. JEL0837]